METEKGEYARDGRRRNASEDAIAGTGFSFFAIRPSSGDPSVGF
jgi:hypothetical protein